MSYYPCNLPKITRVILEVDARHLLVSRFRCYISQKSLYPGFFNFLYYKYISPGINPNSKYLTSAAKQRTERILYSNIYPTRCNVTQFILSGNCSTCFGWYNHPSSGAQTTVSTASGICQFPDKINCVTLHIVGYVLEYSCGARTYER